MPEPIAVCGVDGRYEYERTSMFIEEATKPNTAAMLANPAPVCINRHIFDSRTFEQLRAHNSSNSNSNNNNNDNKIREKN